MHGLQRHGEWVIAGCALVLSVVMAILCISSTWDRGSMQWCCASPTFRRPQQAPQGAECHCDVPRFPPIPPASPPPPPRCPPEFTHFSLHSPTLSPIPPFSRIIIHCPPFCPRAPPPFSPICSEWEKGAFPPSDSCIFKMLRTKHRVLG